MDECIDGHGMEGEVEGKFIHREPRLTIEDRFHRLKIPYTFITVKRFLLCRFLLTLNSSVVHLGLPLMTGEELARHLATPPLLLPALIDDFLYERTTFVITGEAGKGKSVIASQVAVSLSSATPLFGVLTIPKPRRVYYLQLEGSAYDFCTRLYYQQRAIPLDPAYLYWDRDVKFSASNLTLRRNKVKQIETWGKPDLIIIDPIYKAVAGDIAKAEYALAFIDFLEELEETCRCSLLLFHHPHRERFDIKGKKIEETDAYYGHSFIRNHIDTAFVFRQLSEDGQDSELIRTKLREERILPRLQLVYHPETYTCSMLPPEAGVSKREVVERYLLECTKQHKATTYNDVKANCQPISTTFLRELQTEFEDKGWLQLTRKSGHRTLWVAQFPLSTSTNER